MEAEDDLPGQVAGSERGMRVIIDEDQIGMRPGSNHAQWRLRGRTDPARRALL